jgi:hypothetical protein
MLLQSIEQLFGLIFNGVHVFQTETSTAILSKFEVMKWISPTLDYAMLLMPGEKIQPKLCIKKSENQFISHTICVYHLPSKPLISGHGHFLTLTET